MNDEQREAIEWAAGMAYSYAKPLTGESLMMKRWRVLSELFAAKPVELSHYVSDGGACANCNHALIEHKGGRQCPSHATQPSVAAEGGEREVLTPAQWADVYYFARAVEIGEFIGRAQAVFEGAALAHKAAAVAVDEPDNRPTSAIDAVADFLEESANLSIISQFTSIAEWIDARASAVLVDFDAWATTQKWADRYDMDVARIGWTAALASRPPAPIASSEEAMEEIDAIVNDLGKCNCAANLDQCKSTVCLHQEAVAERSGWGWKLAPITREGRAGLTDAMMRAFYVAFEANSQRGDFERLSAGYNAMLEAIYPAAAQPSRAEVPDAAIKSCALIIKGMCMTHPVYEWAELIEARIRFMLKDKP